MFEFDFAALEVDVDLVAGGLLEGLLEGLDDLLLVVRVVLEVDDELVFQRSQTLRAHVLQLEQLLLGHDRHLLRDLVVLIEELLIRLVLSLLEDQELLVEHEGVLAEQVLDQVDAVGEHRDR